MVLAAVVVTAGLGLDRLGDRGRHVATASVPNGGTCLALSVIVNSALSDRPVPLGASYDQQAAIRALNADLADVRSHLFDLDGIRQLGCPKN